MKEIIIFLVGTLAVLCFAISYLQRTRKKILLFNILARLFCVIQYIMLTLFDGAILNIVGIVSNLFAQKSSDYTKKQRKILLIFVNVIIVALGLIFYKNYFTILSVIAMMAHLSALWIQNEKKIRTLTMIGSPFWLVYNLVGKAYASVICDVVGIISLIIAIMRYDILKFKNKEESYE